MAGFDGHCPHCNHDIGDSRLHAIWIDRDYINDFVFLCDECGDEIQMNVHSVPEFELEKAETKVEYQAKRIEMMKRMNIPIPWIADAKLTINEDAE